MHLDVLLERRLMGADLGCEYGLSGSIYFLIYFRDSRGIRTLDPMTCEGNMASPLQWSLSGHQETNLSVSSATKF